MDVIPLVLLVASAIAFALAAINTPARINLIAYGLLLSVACVPLYYILT